MREQQAHTFSTHDGAELFYRHWPATANDGPRKAIVLFHRGHEHSGRIAHLVDELDLPQFDFFAWDARGHGQSPGERGDSPSFATSARDVQTFCDHIGATYGIEEENFAVIAQSVGAVIAATWVHDYAPKIRALVLASPAFKVKLYGSVRWLDPNFDQFGGRCLWFFVKAPFRPPRAYRTDGECIVEGP